MKSILTIRSASKSFIVLSGLSILSVSIMALLDPQMVMDLVQVNLPNSDAYSSIRGVYGGVGLTLCATLIYTMRKDMQETLALLAILWGSYAACRVMTILTDGKLGAFGNQWLVIESVFFAIALVLFSLNKAKARKTMESELAY